MANVILVAYLLIVLALIAVILVQRSEGGGLGIGGGTAGGMMTARGSANLLTRTTAILAALFMATAIGLTILNEVGRGTSSILDQAVQGGAAGTSDQPTTVLDALNKLQDGTSGTTAPAAPNSGAANGGASSNGTSGQDNLNLPVPDATGSGQSSTQGSGN